MVLSFTSFRYVSESGASISPKLLFHGHIPMIILIWIYTWLQFILGLNIGGRFSFWLTDRSRTILYIISNGVCNNILNLWLIKDNQISSLCNT